MLDVFLRGAKMLAAILGLAPRGLAWTCCDGFDSGGVGSGDTGSWGTDTGGTGSGCE